MGIEDWFVTSAIDWFRYSPEEVLRNIASRIFPRPDQPGNLFRPDYVENATSMRILPTAGERLIRWDRRPPEVIFDRGFEPRVRPAAGNFPSLAFDLRNYVETNEASIFVGTARYWRNDTNALRVVQPEDLGTIPTDYIYQYELFAYGGIDVNQALRDHSFTNEREIVFPGGIRREFIRSVRVYSGGELVQIMQNPHFDTRANPDGHVVPLADLPGPVAMENNTNYYPPHGHDISAAPPHNEELRRRRDVAAASAGDWDPDKDWDDLMRGKRLVNKADPYIDRVRARPSVAAVPDPRDSKRAFFFYWNMFVIINVASGTTADTIARGPETIIGNWISLRVANFGYVDAILPNPDNNKEWYFFFGQQYALIDTKLGTGGYRIINGPKNIQSEWLSLRDAGFATVDAVLPHPSEPYECYFFSGEQYVWIRFLPGEVNDTIVNGPHNIQSQWPSLKKAGFKTIDTILVHPDDAYKAYFFSGDQYALIYFNPGHTDDEIINGPKPVAENWPSLHKAEFW